MTGEGGGTCKKRSRAITDTAPSDVNQREEDIDLNLSRHNLLLSASIPHILDLFIVVWVIARIRISIAIVAQETCSNGPQYLVFGKN